MISEININNFKCYGQAEIPLKNLTVLAGANAAGKSSVIQALLLCDYAFNSKKEYFSATDALHIDVPNPRVFVSLNAKDLNTNVFHINLHSGDGVLKSDFAINQEKQFLLQCSVEGKHNFSITYLNAERVGPRTAYPTVYNDHFVFNGSNAAYLLDQADFQQRDIHSALKVGSDTSKFSIYAERWMSEILGTINLSVSTDPESAQTSIRFGNGMTQREIVPTMTGFGISYVFPIVVAGLWCSGDANQVLIIENPEAHLHPAAQSRVGQFLALVAASGVQVIVETHSEHIIDGARMMAAICQTTEEMLVDFFYQADNQIHISPLTTFPDGTLSDWPAGFFDQKSIDLKKLFYLKAGNHDNH